MTSREQVVGRVVVGVDGSVVSVRALQWALRQAKATGAHVEAVAAWEIPTSYGFGPTVRDGEDLAAAAQRALDAALAELSGAYPDVAVHPHVLHGHPAAVLVEQARGADLLVVGRHGHGGFAGALLGSVSHRCVQHAPCPVVVVPAEV